MLVFKKLFLRIINVLLLSCFTIGCQHSEENALVHVPSEEFYETYDYNKPKLKEFVFDGIVLVIDINAINHEELIAWLGLYSKEKNRSLVIESSTLSVGTHRSELELLTEVSLSKSSINNSLYRNNIPLNKISISSMLAAREQGDSISITVSVRDDKSTKIITFNLTLITDSYAVYPT